MGKKLYQDLRAEHEADEVGARFMDSTDVVGDMSRAFGHDFSGVNIHADSIGASRVAGTGVDAIAEGNDIYFGSGYRKGDPVSNGLLAHELTHTMQQGAVGGGMGAQVSSPMGAAQGGMFDWFKKIFGKKKPQISGPTDVKLNTSDDSKQYMAAMRNAGVSVGMDASHVANRLPQATPGKLGGAGVLQSYHDALNAGGEYGIQASNETFANAKNATDISKALMKLSIRMSSTDIAKNDKAYIGDMLSGYGPMVSQYMQNLEHGGVELGGALEGATRTQLGGGAAQSGQQMDPINQDMLGMFSQYVNSDSGMEYLSNTMELYKGADVFEGSQRQALNFLIRGLLNKTGSSHSQVSADHDKFKDGDAAVNVTREANRSLLAMPNLLDKDVSNLPVGTQQLALQYTQMINDLLERLQKLKSGQASA